MLNETEPQFPSEYKGKEEATCISQDATQKKKMGIHMWNSFKIEKHF